MEELVFEPGWLQRQVEAASKEVDSWTNKQRERIFCYNEHTWMHPTYPKENMQVLTCKYCEREMIRFSWGESFVMVKRGREGQWM